MNLTFNERSAITVSSANHAFAVLDQFFDTCEYVNLEFKSSLRLSYTEAPQHLQLHADANFLTYLSRKSREQRSLILTLLTSLPVMHDYPYYLIEGKACNGIGYACEKKHPSISFHSEGKWATPFLTVDKHLFEGDQEVSEVIEHENIFDKASVDVHRIVLDRLVEDEKALQQSGVTSGKEIWASRAELFPSIIFCSSTSDYLNDLAGGGTYNALFKRLKDINAYFEGWTAGDFNRKGFSGGSRLESDTRIDKYQFKYSFPDGNIYQCSMHCEFYDHGMRLHFYPNPNDHKCYIGYVGKKIGA